MPAIPRKKILEKFRKMIAAGQPIVGGGAGTGISAKAEEAGGIDLIIIYNSGRYRMAGRGSAAGLLAYGNANEIVKDMAREVLPVVKNTPVLAGVNGTDPFVLMPQFLAELKAMGFSGVQNFPTIGLFDGSMRQSFEETGMGFGLEVDMIALAHALDLLTTPYVFNPDEARAMTKAGADIVVAHMGVTTGGTIGATSAKSLDDCVSEIDAIAKAARSVGRMSSCSAMAGRSRCPTTRATSWSGPTACTAFTAPRAWSGCRRRQRSPHKPGASSRSASRTASRQRQNRRLRRGIRQFGRDRTQMNRFMPDGSLPLGKFR